MDSFINFERKSSNLLRNGELLPEIIRKKYRYAVKAYRYLFYSEQQVNSPTTKDSRLY